MFFFFNDTATTEIYTLSLHDALPISCCCGVISAEAIRAVCSYLTADETVRMLLCVEVVECLLEREKALSIACEHRDERSEEHTSELQSRQYLVCRLLLEKKKYITVER